MSLPNTTYGARRIREMLADAKGIYFLGIGGVSVSSLARMSADLGFCVGGYDRGKTPTTEALEAEGITVWYETDPAHLAGFDAVVYTVAIPEENPEYRAALAQGLPCFSRADYLGYLMTAYRHRIGFSGSHGKSTATCMAARILMEAGADPTVLAGASMPGLSGSFRRGSRENLIFEACEYMDSFLQFSPTVAVVLNVEMDHVDYFHSMEQLRASFRAFCDRVGENGTVVLNGDDEETCRALAGFPGKTIVYSARQPDADYFADEIVLEGGYASFTLCEKTTGGRTRVQLSIPGSHHVWNALAAVAAVGICGVTPRAALPGLEAFRGADRRMQYWGRLNGARVFEDYAHHPTEVAATLTDAGALGRGRLLCLFQPHTYSRTKALFWDFVRALRRADRILVAPIYGAREQPDDSIDAPRLAAAIGDRACAVESLEAAADRLLVLSKPGDTVIVMGAGDVNRVLSMLKLESD